MGRTIQSQFLLYWSDEKLAEVRRVAAERGETQQTLVRRGVERELQATSSEATATPVAPEPATSSSNTNTRQATSSAPEVERLTAELAATRKKLAAAEKALANKATSSQERKQRAEAETTTEEAIARIRSTTVSGGLSDFGAHEREKLQQAFTDAMAALDVRGSQKLRAAIANYINFEWEYAVREHAEAQTREQLGERLTKLEARERAVMEEENKLDARMEAMHWERELFPVEDFQHVRHCLHPDKPARSKEALDKAFGIFTTLFEVRKVRRKEIVVRKWRR